MCRRPPDNAFQGLTTMQAASKPLWAPKPQPAILEKHTAPIQSRTAIQMASSPQPAACICPIKIDRASPEAMSQQHPTSSSTVVRSWQHGKKTQIRIAPKHPPPAYRSSTSPDPPSPPNPTNHPAPKSRSQTTPDSPDLICQGPTSAQKPGPEPGPSAHQTARPANAPHPAAQGPRSSPLGGLGGAQFIRKSCHFRTAPARTSDESRQAPRPLIGPRLVSS